jgi:hypothetical protein
LLVYVNLKTFKLPIKHLSVLTQQTKQEVQMLSERAQYIEVIGNATEGLTLESFIAVMTTANVINLAYTKLFPDSSSNRSYEEMWENIKKVTIEKTGN